MTTRVYQFGLRAPIEGEAVVRQQMRAAHDYRNELVAIERGRRAAIRMIHAESQAVLDALDTLRAAPRKERLAPIRALSKARRDAEQEHADDMARIKELDGSIRRDARALTSCWWGTYLGIEASADQARKSPLYERDMITPLDISFVRGPRLGREAFDETDPRAVWWLGESQVGMHVQGRELLTPAVFAARDQYVRIELEPDRRGRQGYPRYGVLWLRVGSSGREPIWGKWPIKLHRAIVDAAKWSWVRVSSRREGMRERWSCEITLDLPAEIASPRMLDTNLAGAVAVEVCWESVLGSTEEIRVARWLDSRGERGEIVLPKRLVWAIRHSETFRSVRDTMRNEMCAQLQRALVEAKGTLPEWLISARNTMQLWKSPERFRSLVLRWRKERCDAAREAYEILDAWEQRENHLYEYECSERAQALRARRELYRVTAAQWSRRYRDLVLDNRDLSREARWGDESDVRFTAAPAELRQILRGAFGSANEYPWKKDSDDDVDWLDGAIERWAIERWCGEQSVGTARTAEMGEKSTSEKGGAWARRKSARILRETARKTTEGDAE